MLRAVIDGKNAGSGEIKFGWSGDARDETSLVADKGDSASGKFDVEANLVGVKGGALDAENRVIVGIPNHRKGCVGGEASRG